MDMRLGQVMYIGYAPGYAPSPVYAPNPVYAPTPPAANNQPAIHPSRAVPRFEDNDSSSNPSPDFVASQMCREYARRGTCQYEGDCRWFHIKLPRRVCYDYLLKNHCEVDCRFEHLSAQQLYDYVALHHSDVLQKLKQERSKRKRPN